MKKLMFALGLAAILATGSMAAPLDSEQDPGNGGGGGDTTENTADLGSHEVEGVSQKGDATGIDGQNFVPSNNPTSILTTLWQIVIGAHQDDLR